MFSVIIASMLPLSQLGINPLREEVIPMLEALSTLAVNVVSGTIGTVIGTILGTIIYNRWFKK